MIVVSDTSPLNYLLLIQQAGLLFRLFEQVVVPQAVADELGHSATPAVVRQFMAAPPAWFRVRQCRSIDATLPRLGTGEIEAISLAQELGAELLSCDDGDARRTATQRGIRVAGTLGVLELGAMRGHIDFPSCVEQLGQTTMRMPEDIVARMLREDAARMHARR
jgi:predicted nucleic acid-binding protein